MRTNEAAVSMAIAIALCATACGTRDEAVATETAPPAAPRSGVIHGAGWTADDSDPHLPRVAGDRRALVAPDDTLFHLAIESDVIMEAHDFRVTPTLIDYGGRDREPAGDPVTMEEGRYRSIIGTVDRVLLGSATSEVRFDAYCAPAAQAERYVSCAALRELVSTPSRHRRMTLFLCFAREDTLYFAGYTPEALQPRLERAHAQAIHATRTGARARLERAPHPPLQARVDAEIARITSSPREQYDAMRALLALGGDAVPGMVRHMGDRRALPSATIMVENAPDFWEAYGHYSIGAVVDALALVASLLSNGPGCSGELLHAGEGDTTERARARCEEKWFAFVARGLDDGAFGDAWR